MRLKLKMQILQTYGNQARFARVCGKGEDWVSRVVTGRYNPTAHEKDLILSNLPNATDDIFQDQEMWPR